MDQERGRGVSLTSYVELPQSGVYVEHGCLGFAARAFSAPSVQIGPGRKAKHGTSSRKSSVQAGRSPPGDGRGARVRPGRVAGRHG